MPQSKTALSTNDRRRFLQYAWSGVQSSLALSLLGGTDLFAAPRFGDNPFTLGVASGDPTPDGIVLWTSPESFVGRGWRDSLDPEPAG